MNGLKTLKAPDARFVTLETFLYCASSYGQICGAAPSEHLKTAPTGL
jgi:hypothetical protein